MRYESHNSLQEYIRNSELRVFNDDFHIRLSPDLAKKYDRGEYKQRLILTNDLIRQIKSLGLKYPNRANPVFYMYIVPEQRFKELLDLPNGNERTVRGKAVDCFDIDGFDYAYGESEKLTLNLIDEKMKPTMVVNNIHELSHIIHSQFFSKNRFIREGFCEMVPWYLLGYEKKIPEYIDAIKNIPEDEIYNVQDLMTKADFLDLVYGQTCAFRSSYISAYLFVRGIIERVQKNLLIDKFSATQQFLELLHYSKNTDEKIVFELADFIGMSHNELLTGKSLQISVKSEIEKMAQK